MSNPTGIGKAGLILVKRFEGFPAGGRPYWDRPASDPRRIPTIGYGTTRINGRPVTMNTPRLTEPQAAALLRKQINGTNFAAVLNRLLKSLGRDLNQNEYDAILSCIYNLGAGILDRGRSLGDALRASNWRSRVPEAILLYCEPNNPSVHKGLLRRRKAEVRLFRSGRGLDTTRPIKTDTDEKREIENLRDRRDIAKRNGGWGGDLDPMHLESAIKSKNWLRRRANALEDRTDIKDKEYQKRKVKFLRDVAFNRNGRG